ncbi:hypothetical protein AB0H51_27880 [Streptomyces griseoluteus]|uniref:hypothetical protein n=1 Tax=Streptomyces griseoluteus TaxID=29306 RepID=UPI0033FE87B5
MGGDFTEQTSFFDRAVRHGADAWHRLDSEEEAARRARAHMRATQTRRRNSHNGPVQTVVKVWPEVMRVALKAARGDASRLRIVSDTEVWVM